MSLDIGRVLRGALATATTRRGGAVLAAFVVVGLGDAVVRNTLSARAGEALAAANATAGSGAAGANATGPLAGGVSSLPAEGGAALALDLPLSAAFGLFLVAFAAGEALRLVAIRTFADVPVGRDWPRTYALLLGAGALTQVLTALGYEFYVVPAVVLAAVFYFVRQEVVLAGSGVRRALRRSFGYAREDPLEVLALLATVLLVRLALVGPLSYGGLDATTTATLAVVGVQIADVYGVAVATDAYGRVADREDGAVGPGTGAGSDPADGA